MEEKKQKRADFAWPSAAVVAALAATLLHNASPLISSRPDQKSKSGHEYTAIGDQTVVARLWQDPFAAVATFRSEETEKQYKARLPFPETNRVAELQPHSLGEVVSQIYRRTSGLIHGQSNVTVFCVMVSNGPYVEDAERRMRTRYAVVSALGVANYVPWDEDHIGYFSVPWPRGAAYESKGSEVFFGEIPLEEIEKDSGSDLVVPYEWFQPSSVRAAKLEDPREATSAVLVLWLDADAFADHPAKRLAQLVLHLRAPGRDRIRFKLLDPRLYDLMQENWASASAVSNALSGMQLYSSWSTTADALLVADATWKPREAIGRELNNRGMNFFNVTATDDEMADRLIEELARRGVNLSDPNNHIALISESDTYYGRALPLTFAAKVLLARDECYFAKQVDHLAPDRERPDRFSAIVQQLRTCSISWPENIHLSSYLRGVDGRLPGEVSPKAESGQEKDKAKEAERLERPEGPSQLDYMPRLAHELHELELETQHDGRSGFKAIGILGSDVYDKLLLLQSLHNLFPHAIFFTTDLDARLLHPSELKWSRNLIVASSFDLKLNNIDAPDSSFDRPPPPFRDSYQTGEYLGTLVAFGRYPKEWLTGVKAQVFEIGRNGTAYILARPRRVSESAYSSHSIYPERPRLDLGFRTIVNVALVIASACLLLVWYSASIQHLWRLFKGSASGVGEGDYEQRLRSINRRSTCWLRRCVGIFLLLGGLLAYLIWHDHHRDGGEPFSLVAGISLWPSEIIDLTATGVSWFLLIKAMYDLRRNEAEIGSKFGLGWSLRPQQFAGRSSNFFRWEWSEGKVDALRLWQQNLYYGQTRNRRLRCFWASAFCLALGVSLLYLFGLPFRPYRGQFSFWTDNIISLLCTGSVVILIFFVVDATLLCNRFVELLSAQTTVWPQGVLEDFERKRGMDRDDLPEWLDIQLIAKRTETVGRLIFYPFVVLFLMIVARTSFFDHFDWPISLRLLLGVLAAYAIYCALSLQRTAERAKHEEIRQLNEKLLRARMRGDNDKHRVEQILSTIEEIRANENGAFAPLSKHPILAALAMPFGGAGILSLLDFLALK